MIPEQQHGFRVDKSTLTACKLLLEDIRKTLSKPGRPLYCVSVDYRAAFDSAPRDRVLSIMAQVGVPVNVLALIRAIFQRNEIIIDDGVTELPSFP